MSRFEDAIEMWRGVMDGYVEVGDLDAAARVNFDRGYLLTYMARFVEALANSQEALDFLGDHITPHRAMILGGRGAILGFAGFGEMADDLIEQAESIAPNFGADVQGRVAWTHCVADFSAGRYADAVANGRRAVDLLRECNDAWTLTDALGWLANTQFQVGDYAEASRLGTEGEALASRLGHVGAHMLTSRARFGCRALLDGDLEGYEADARADVSFTQSLNTPFEAQSYSLLGAVLQLRGRLDEALECFEKSTALDVPSSFSGLAWGFTTLNRALARRPEECRSMLAERFEELMDPAPIRPGRTTMILGATEAAAISAFEKEAGDLLVVVRDRVTHESGRFWDGAFPSRLAGMAATTVGDWDGAESFFEDALRSLGSRPNAFEAPQINHWYGKMMADRGRNDDQQRALDLIGSALTEYDRLGMPVHAEMARELLRVHA